MIYVCDHCHYLFQAEEQPEQCPDCGKSPIRSATDAETQEFMQDASELDRAEITPLPDYCELTIQSPAYFKFLLPVTAFGYRDDMCMEISVEYMISKDQAIYMANVWCRVKGAKSKHLLYTPAVPIGVDATECIVTFLSEDATFYQLMHDYIYEAAKHRPD